MWQAGRCSASYPNYNKQPLSNAARRGSKRGRCSRSYAGRRKKPHCLPRGHINRRPKCSALQIQPVFVSVKRHRPAPSYPALFHSDQKVNGKAPTTQELRDIYAWHRDMDTELPQHLWLFAKSKGAEIALSFQPVIISSDFEDRKTLARHCHEAVSNGVEHHMALAA